MHNPLQIDFKKQLGILLTNSEAVKHISDEYLVILQNPVIGNGGIILTVISQLLRTPPLTSLIAQLFRPLIVDLCARWIDLNSDYESTLYALAFLLGWHPEIYP